MYTFNYKREFMSVLQPTCTRVASFFFLNKWSKSDSIIETVKNFAVVSAQ